MQTKVVNKCENLSKMYVWDIPHAWVQWPSLTEYWYNTSYHSVIKMCLFEPLYGINPSLHVPYMPKDSYVAVVDIYTRDREVSINLLKHHLRRTVARMK